MPRRHWLVWWCLAASLLALSILPGAAGAAPAASPATTPAALSAAHVAWWQWAFSFPLTTHPLNPNPPPPAPTPTCATGQSGSEWFLGGVINSGGTVTRTCTIPAGKTLVVAVANVECSDLELSPFFAPTDASAQECAAGVAVPGSPLHATGVRAKLDEQRLAVPRVPTPAFAFTVPGATDNILGCGQPATPCRATSGRSAADGYLLVLAPLTVGRHRLRFGGTFDAGTPTPTDDFVLKITYRITVLPAV